MATLANHCLDNNDVRNVLFLAPSLPYARTVVRNLAKDLDRKGIPYTSSDPNTWASPYLNTAKVHVKFLYCDPIEYTKRTHLLATHVVFGKLEMFAHIPDDVRKYVRRPDTSLIKYIVDAEAGDVAIPQILPKTSYLPEISKVHFNPPMTIVLWEDGTKTTVRCQEGDAYSDEVGLALCIAKKALGNKGNVNNIFRKWVPEGEYSEYETTKDGRTVGFNFDGGKFLNNVRESLTERLRNTVKECITID